MRLSMRIAGLTASCARPCQPVHRWSAIGKRWLRISTSMADSLNIHPAEAATAASPDARFDVTGGPSSLLSVSLSASQNLYTQRGTLAGLAGKAENTISTLSVLEPFSRTFLRIPFLYQKITSTTPVTALISTKASNTSIAVVHLDGTLDWVLAGQSLLAWSGQTLSVRPTMNYKLSLAYWGSSEVTGRGLLALIGRGSISKINLKAGESYIVHPGNVVAHTVNPTPPLPYRFKSSSFRLQVPNIVSMLPDARFVKVMRGSRTWQVISKTVFAIRTWTRRTIWGDRLFLQFRGPTTILLQTRASRISDILTSQDVNELADAEPGVAQRLVTPPRRQIAEKTSSALTTNDLPVKSKAPGMQTASLGVDGKVSFEPTGDSAPPR